MQKLLLYSLLMLLLWQGCAKEYSYEGGTVNIRTDTTTGGGGGGTGNTDPVCAACVNVTEPLTGEWSFRSGSWKLCGTADSAIALGNRTAFTFYGPSACSADTGMAITIYLNDTLNRDRTNLLNNRGAFYCYDRVTPSYIFMSPTNGFFSVNITSYVHSTREVTGTFYGNVIRANGNGAGIESGKFKVKIL